jgi:hypothetical protein
MLGSARSEGCTDAAGIGPRLQGGDDRCRRRQSGRIVERHGRHVALGPEPSGEHVDTADGRVTRRKDLRNFCPAGVVRSEANSFVQQAYRQLGLALAVQGYLRSLTAGRTTRETKFIKVGYHLPLASAPFAVQMLGGGAEA